MIIGITGYKRSGKDTAARVFEAHGYVRYAFADPIKIACMSLFDWSSEFIEAKKEDVDPRWGISPRRAMQLLGTEVFRAAVPDMVPGFTRTFWIDRMVEKYNRLGKPDMVVSDVRFPDEAMKIYELGGAMVRIDRAGLYSDGHESEAHIPHIPVDYVIENDGTSIDLIRSVNELVSDLKTEQAEIDARKAVH